MIKRAVVLFNLGGPDKPSSIQPFLFNLFNDGAIINLPKPLRWLVAKIVSKRRAPVAKKIYAEIGGSSPLLNLTKEQAAALEVKLNKNKENQSKVFVAMRYWHPMISSIAVLVKDFNPDEIVLLPLYPQFSTTTTGSSLSEWEFVSKKINLEKKTRTICCYPIDEHLVKAQADLLKKEISKIKKKCTRSFFSPWLTQKGNPNGRSLSVAN